MSPEPLVVGLNARLEGGKAGGIEQYIAGVAHGLSGLDGPERYLFLTHPLHQDWLKPFLGGQCASLPDGTLGGTPLGRRRLAAWMPARLKAALKRVLPVTVPHSHGVLESAGAEVIHFPSQDGFLTDRPTLYQCHDLQHRYYPDFFSAQELRWRDTTYGVLGRAAGVTLSMTRYGARDLVGLLGLDPAKVAVVPGGSILSAYAAQQSADPLELRRRLGLPPRFLLYPAQTWPHKNHAKLAQALGLLRKQGLEIPVLCTGRRNESFGALQESVRAAGAADLMLFPGYLDGPALKALYGMADGMVFPSLFEGWGLPVTEAFEAGLPVACANATALPEQVAGAALLFDPRDPASIGEAMRRLWEDPEERRRLAALGRLRVERLTWDRSARILRAWYRKLARRKLDKTDQDLVRESLDPSQSF